MQQTLDRDEAATEFQHDITWSNQLVAMPGAYAPPPKKFRPVTFCRSALLSLTQSLEHTFRRGMVQRTSEKVRFSSHT